LQGFCWLINGVSFIAKQGNRMHPPNCQQRCFFGGLVPALLKATNILSKNQSHFNFVCLGFMLTQ
jgi:hypothetical protein